MLYYQEVNPKTKQLILLLNPKIQTGFVFPSLSSRAPYDGPKQRILALQLKVVHIPFLNTQKLIFLHHSLLYD